MSNATDVIKYFRGVRDSHKGGPYIDWEEFDALAESHAELLEALEGAYDIICRNGLACPGSYRDAIAKARGEAQ